MRLRPRVLLFVYRDFIKGKIYFNNNAILDNTIISKTTLMKFVMLNSMLSVYVFISMG